MKVPNWEKGGHAIFSFDFSSVCARFFLLFDSIIIRSKEFVVQVEISTHCVDVFVTGITVSL